ncbi:shikimate kinase, partial [Lonsdalea populi]
IILLEENRRFMQERGSVIYLHAPAGLLAQRLVDDPLAEQRPTLTGRPIAVEMALVLAEREAFYQSVAHHVIDATQTPQSIVADVLQALRLAAA